LIICDTYNISYKNVIIGIDPTLLNENDIIDSWKSIGYFYYHFIGDSIKDNYIRNYKSRILFSPSYFKSSILQIPKLIKGQICINFVKTTLNEGLTRRPDGSINYPKDYCCRLQQLVDFEASTSLNESFRNFRYLSEDRKRLFESIITFLQEQGVGITFWCCPYHPLLYKRIVNMPGMRPSMMYMYEYATIKNISICGRYDSKEMDLDNRSFYDGYHLRKEIGDSIIVKFLTNNYNEESCI